MSNTGFKNISRYRQPRQAGVDYGYQVCVQWRGERRYKRFPVAKYSDAREAMEAAIAWRDEQERQLRKPRSERRILPLQSPDSGGAACVPPIRVGQVGGLLPHAGRPGEEAGLFDTRAWRERGQAARAARAPAHGMAFLRGGAAAAQAAEGDDMNGSELFPVRFGHLRRIDVSCDPSGLAMIGFSGVAQYTPEILAAIEGWMRGGPPARLPDPRFEWPCLYCGSPNRWERSHCTQCGAARSVVLG